MGLLPLNYRRPALVNTPPSSDNQPSLSRDSSDNISAEKRDGSVRSGSSGSIAGIPEALSFDRIINGATCPPCTTRDFMNYLVYIERAAENLQFFLWYKDYSRRFKDASTSDLSLSKEWTQAMEDEAVARTQKELADLLRKEDKTGAAAAIFKGTDFEKRADGVNPAKESKDPFTTPPRSSGADTVSQYTESNPASGPLYQETSANRVQVTIQPFREEIDRIIATYIVDGAPRQLNLSSREQKVVIHALAYTTHPSAFRTIAQSIETTLRWQSHPKFIRWSICNGNPPRVFFARALGVGLIIGSTVAAVVMTLSTVGRGYRALAAIGWVLGISTLIAAWKGMCVVLHGMHHRHVRPWELFGTEEDLEARSNRSFDSLGSSNSYEDEPWIVNYQKRNVVRKVFDREVWIKEPALRQIQDTIFVQSMLSALVLSGILATIFVVVPGGGFF